MTRPNTCSKCSGSMEPGVILDSMPGRGRVEAKWVGAPPTRTLWGHGVNLHGEEPIPVIAFRCDGCGFLELFAIREPAE